MVYFRQSKSIDIEFTESHILRFREEGAKTKCSAVCSKCEKSTVCEYTTYWNISNFQAHLKGHLRKKISAEKSSVSLHENNAAELDKLLED